MSQMLRSVKNVTKGYSSVQVKVRNATSNDPWGPTGTDMADIAKITYNSSTDFYEVMDMLDKRLNDKGKNWRHVLKSLKVLDYCLHEGSELCVTWARKNIYIIRTLREFIYLDEEGRDVGQNIRVSAKELTSLIMDEERLRSERQNRHSWKSRVTGLEDMAGGGYESETQSTPRKQRERPANRARTEDEDLEYRLALEASKNEAEEDARRRANKNRGGEEDDDLAKALRLSKEEEEARKREFDDANASSLFDDTPAQTQQPTGFNQGYQQQTAVDWFGNPMGQQQPQSTGYLNNAYNQQPLQAQQTAFPQDYSGYYQQPQATGFDQSFQQQQQPQQQFLQPQATGYNPWATQMQPQPQQQPQQTAQPGSNNPWALSSPASQEALRPQATGSNNPFASSFNRPQQTQQRAPTLSALQEQKTATHFNQPAYNPITSYQAPPPAAAPFQQPAQTAQPAQPMDPHRAQLNALLSSGEGQDTFGNVGNMRIPAQHTAPGTFVNSAGQGLTKLEASRTGNNPFLQSQFTGMPQQQFPAQTGPANGYASSNPFGQKQQGPQQSGSLIDL
ncbi:epsin-1 [Aureobasidium namibiae CBS 147.97]|uniref:Epsin-1 n=1 Tax=Aureobasidium namibiae CBS 147.97 TaxID=1043004 RepID=A0A074WKU1_9PEZI|nr:epsin-1 [Aureobasidium namibiae CBS 147.97]KEQ73688.1 epsin-1 [Aureobasidium namibiae CBS 147.97]